MYYQLESEKVVAHIKESFMADLKKLTVDVLKCPRIALDELRSYAGKANHVATLVYYWRPFLDQVWAALCESKPSNAPAGYVWVKQVRSSLSWVLAFFE